MTEHVVRGGPELPQALGGFDLTDQSRFAAGVPYDLFARLRREAPVLFHPHLDSPDGDGFWVLTRYADIAAAAADPVFSAQGGGDRKGGGSHLADLEIGVHAGVWLAMMDDPRHASVKKPLLTAMSGAVSAAVLPRLREHAAEVVAAGVAAGRCDVVPAISEPYALRSIALLLGVPEPEWPRLAGWMSDVLGFTNRRTGLVDELSTATYAQMERCVRSLFAAKTDAPGTDVTSTLAVGESALATSEREANVVMLLITGYEQPRNTIASAVLTFAEHPDQWQALRADRSLLPGAIEEVLRWAPPNPYNRRTATEDVELHRQLIRAGDKVTFWWPSANRDEEVFPDASTFDIRRSPNPHLSFGHGAHACLGDQFARQQIALALTALLDRVAEIHLTGPVVWAGNNKHTVPLSVPVEFVRADGT